MRRWLMVALVLEVMSPAFVLPPAAAQSEGEVDARLDFLFGAHRPYGEFLAALKTAVGAGDRQAVAAMVAYPLTTKVAGKPITLRSAQEFVAHYDRLVAAKVVVAVERQTYATLFANFDGVMVGEGEIWFSEVCSDQRCVAKKVKIIAINP